MTPHTVIPWDGDAYCTRCDDESRWLKYRWALACGHKPNNWRAPWPPPISANQEPA